MDIWGINQPQFFGDEPKEPVVTVAELADHSSARIGVERSVIYSLWLQHKTCIEDKHSRSF